MHLRILLAFVAATAATACGDIVEPPLPDDKLSDRLFVYVALDPDSDRQWIEASPVDVRSQTSVTVSVAIYRSTKGQAEARWELVARDSVKPPFLPGLCLYIHSTSCLELNATLEPGEVYMVEAMAPGFRSARGVTRIIGDFEVESATLTRRGDTHILGAEWTASEHVHRYLLGVRYSWIFCTNCIRAWTVDVDSTSFTGPLPQIFVDSLGHEPTVEVMAADEHLHAFVTSGLGGQLLGLPPVMNVEGGFGVVGSLRYRTRSIAMPDQTAGQEAERRMESSSGRRRP